MQVGNESLNFVEIEGRPTFHQTQYELVTHLAHGIEIRSPCTGIPRSLDQSFDDTVLFVESSVESQALYHHTLSRHAGRLSVVY